MIKYKLIEHERVEDAPFVGALISAVNCSVNCPKCFNQHLKEMPTQVATEHTLIASIVSNPFNQGIILGGLEWSEQPEELMLLVKVALKSNLKVMIYTGLTYEQFIKRVPEILFEKGVVYLKTGKFDEKQTQGAYFSFGVWLASANQRIINLSSLGKVSISA